ncbi:hypothetical protein GCM10009676_29980 [Prauserella halophila]|uniref:Uncharacterized protein n=2 Tax=Prauserella halophila TaxID=185641 RepID=A0ABN1WAH3_9PSEU
MRHAERMDDAARTGTDADGDAALDAVAAELYALDRGEFTQARNERARSAADRDLAARIRKLRKPTVAAARVNRFARRHPDRVRELRSLGDELRSAHAEFDGDRIRELSQRRRELVGELSELEAAGVGGAVSPEVHDTFDAAVTDVDAGEAVARGCLVSALQPGDVFAGGLSAPGSEPGAGGRGGAGPAPGDRRGDGQSENRTGESGQLGGGQPGGGRAAATATSGEAARRAQAERQDREHRGKKQQRRERNRRGQDRHEQERHEQERHERDQLEHESREQDRLEQEHRERERLEQERREQERLEQERREREQRLREQRDRRRKRNAELAEARAARGDAVTELREAEAAEAEARRRTTAARKAFDTADRRVSEAEAALAEVTDPQPDPQPDPQ